MRDGLYRNLLPMISRHPMTSDAISLHFNINRARIHHAVKYLRRNGNIIYGDGSVENPYRLTVNYVPDPYSDEELREIWSNVRCDEDPYKILSDFAVCSEDEAKQMVMRWKEIESDY